MPHGKPAFVRCVQLDDENQCLLFAKPERPSVCVTLQPQLEMCGKSNSDAFHILQEMELRTKPETGQARLIGL